MPRRIATLSLVGLILLAGCSAPVADGPTAASTDVPSRSSTTPIISPDTAVDGDTAAAGPDTDRSPSSSTSSSSGTNPSTTSGGAESPTPTSIPTPTPIPTDTPGTSRPPDPEEDVKGWENGYWYNESIDVREDDGLDGAEFDRVKARAMARVEVIRGLEFNESVNIEFRKRSEFEFRPRHRHDPWREQYWEALFVVDEPTSTFEAYVELYDVIVDGLAYGGNKIVLLVENTTSPRVNRNTLAHELVHAVESQRNVYAPAQRPTMDARRARRALVEGSAIFYEGRYAERCRGEWSCLDLPPSDEIEGADRINKGLYVDFAMAYTAGSRFVEALDERGGTALEGARRSLPISTEQIIHPSTYPEETPVSVHVPNRSSEDWHRFAPPEGSRTGDTVGESRLYTMLWYDGVVPGPDAEVNRAQQIALNYSDPATAGWAGDRFVPYTNGSGYGYVLKTAWDTAEDAEEFHRAYLSLLRSQNATEIRDGVFRIPGGEPYSDAFRVTRRNDTVVVVNAPTVDQLDDVHGADD